MPTGCTARCTRGPMTTIAAYSYTGTATMRSHHEPGVDAGHQARRPVSHLRDKAARLTADLLPRRHAAVHVAPAHGVRRGVQLGPPPHPQPAGQIPQDSHRTNWPSGGLRGRIRSRLQAVSLARPLEIMPSRVHCPPGVSGICQPAWLTLTVTTSSWTPPQVRVG
jgi:hypothetical protein